MAAGVRGRAQIPGTVPGPFTDHSRGMSLDKCMSTFTHAQSRLNSLPQVGCGNSSFSADLYDAGFPNIVNIDFSTVVIDSMRQKHEQVSLPNSDIVAAVPYCARGSVAELGAVPQERPHMRWEVMDMTDLKYESGTFDVVIDKAAMDALMTDEGDVWDPNPEVLEAADRMCGHMSRVLKPHGVFLQISFAQPHFRRRYLLVNMNGCIYILDIST